MQMGSRASLRPRFVWPSHCVGLVGPWQAGRALLGPLARDRRATTALEYGLIASMIAVVLVLVATSFDVNVDSVGAMVSKLAAKL